MKKIISLLLVLAFSFPCVTYARAETEEIKGVWVGTVSNLDYPSEKGLSSKQLKAEIDSIIDGCIENSINTIFFQVRPNSDALYKSNVYPWSEVLSGKQGTAPADNFDPLSYIIEKAHAKKISLHAWINPYRIGDMSVLCASNPAVKHPEYIVTCSDGKAYYDPSLPEVRKLVADGVSEILENYDVDGIHFDDYFYPYDVDSFDDSASFAKYGKEFKDVADFRRNNVNLLVKQISELVHKKDKTLKFGISPFGIWDNKRDNPLGSESTGMSSYSEIYADSRYWVTENLIDYICPQIYWSFENKSAPFATLVDWWSELCKDSKTDLYIGIAHYKQGTDESGWQDKDQILRQLSYCESKSAVKGTVLFRYGTMVTPVTYDDMPEPTVPATTSSIKITGPANNYKTEGSNCSVTGMADPKKPLKVNGMTVNMTEHGYFSAYLPLKKGNNTFVFVNGNDTKSITVKRITPDKNNYQSSVISSVFPEGECSFYAGERLTLTATAAKDFALLARINGKDFEMSFNEKVGKYTLDYFLPNLMTEPSEKITVQFIAKKDGREYTFEKITEITTLASPVSLYTTSECYVYDSAYGGSMMDNYQLPKGTKLRATAFAHSMYRLDTGKWVNDTDVQKEQVSSTIDIDTSKYSELQFSFKNPVTYQCDVTESGKLILEMRHKSGDFSLPELPRGISVQYVRSSTKTIAIVSVRNKKITGYYLSESDDCNLSLWILQKTEGLSDKTIVLDVGHGGEDPGALGPPGTGGATEADLNLSMAKLLKQKLEKSGATVYITRTDDSTLLLKERAELIRSKNPDLCISIHHNSVSRESDFNKASGALVLYSRETALPLAKDISFSLTNGTGLRNEGFKTQSLNVCRDYRFPCILIECGYVCNPSEYERLLSDNFKNSMCNNIVLEVADYFS
ncbi:MAG: family 10 glycosylhydrolase [Clostridia bacterium]|nr:family 10 glycosylhydrolase [Clostridia bacterium]